MHKRTASLLLFFLCAFVVALCLRGIDFGYQWDETSLLSWARHSVRTGSLLPPHYDYPSFSHYLLLACLLPEVIQGSAAFVSGESLRAGLIDLMRSDAFLMRARTVFCLLMLLSIPLVHLLLRRWGRRPAEALLAAAIVALSWEGYYHALWISPSGPMITLTTLTLFLVVYNRPREAGIAAGLAAGCKYPMALLVMPVLTFSLWQNKPAGGPRAALAVLVSFLLAFYLMIPGVWLDSVRFWTDVNRISHIYGTSFGGYTVAPWREHLPLMARYLTGPMLSSYAPAAWLFAVLAGAGTLSLWRENRRNAMLFFLFPAAYLGYFAAQNVMLVRNYLPVLPFMGILAARGFSFLTARSQRVKTVLAALVLVALTANAFRIIQSAESLAHRSGSEVQYARNFAAFAHARPLETFRLSEQTARIMRQAGGSSSGTNLKENGTAQWAAFYSNEVLDWHRWTANRPGIIRAAFGPLDVNLDYYPTWEGNPRIIIVSFAEAVRLGVFDTQGK